MTPKQMDLIFIIFTILIMIFVLLIICKPFDWVKSRNKTHAQKLADKRETLIKRLEKEKQKKQLLEEIKSKKKIDKIIKLLFEALSAYQERIVTRGFTNRETLIYWSKGCFSDKLINPAEGFEKLNYKLCSLIDNCSAKERELILCQLNEELNSNDQYQTRIDKDGFLFVKV